MQNKKIIIPIIVLVITVFGFFTFSSGEKIKKEEITYKQATSDMIRVELPFPGVVTGKTFTVIGEARGMWYFEGSFPVTVLDKNGNPLVTTYATAQDEWMVEGFVPFKSEIKAPESYIGPATLILMRNNASGLPEHDAEISFPFTIEY